MSVERPQTVIAVVPSVLLIAALLVLAIWQVS